MFNYKCYGLTISSNLEIPILEVAKFSEPDVFVENTETIPFDKSTAQEINGFWVNKEKEVYFDVDFGSMIISGGKTIKFTLRKNKELSDAIQHVLGSGLTAILYQRKTLVLHASAVEKSGKAILFVGRSGSGKSSTAWTALKSGYSLISDDVSVIRFEDGHPMVYSSYPRNKVARDVLQFNNEKIAVDEETLSDERPKYYRKPDCFKSGRFPITHIVFLSKKDTTLPLVEDMDSLKLFHAIYRNSFRFKLIKPLGFAKKHLERTTRLFDKTRCHALALPKDGLALNRTFDLINTLTT